LIALLAGQNIAYDAWQLITPEAVLKRWIAIGLLFVAVTIVWYRVNARKYTRSSLHHLVWLMVIADILFASYYVYLNRGVAANAVALYAVPVIVSGVLLSKRALFASALLSIAAYLLAVNTYATLNFNEGYKIERYGEALFYSGATLVIAGLLWAVVHAKKRL
jgi:beta-lactamase regulating signal transducer with metallopeptidase domain